VAYFSAGLDDLRDAFIDRNAGTDSEDQDGDNKTPEIDLLAMPERVFPVWRLVRLTISNNHNTWLPVSMSEWIPYDNIAELTVVAAAMNLVTAISEFPISAANITFWIKRPYCFAFVVVSGRLNIYPISSAAFCEKRRDPLPHVCDEIET